MNRARSGVRLIFQGLTHSQRVMNNIPGRTPLDGPLFWGGPESVAGWMDGSRAVWRCMKARELSTSILSSLARRSWRGARCCICVSERGFDSPGDSPSWHIPSRFTASLAWHPLSASRKPGSTAVGIIGSIDGTNGMLCSPTHAPVSRPVCC